MQSLDVRSTVEELSRDLGWLEDHCRQDALLAVHAGNLRLASALTRNVVGPFLEGQPPRPLHIAVVGGAGAGKSTVVNFLAGAVVAEANPQAGYTRHPTAYLSAGPGFPWPSYIGFLGPLRRISEDQPANLDEDVYQVRRVPTASGADPLADFVIWDCPDMTTWASTAYVSRLMEVAALADVIVYVASDERYNDEVPTQFLHMVVKAGKAVVVVLTKMKESNAPAFIEHFRNEVLGKLPRLPDGSIPPVPVIPFPQVSAEIRSDPAGAGTKLRVPLLNQVLVQCESAEAARRRTAENAVKYLNSAGSGLLDVAKRDIAEFETWKSIVRQGKAEFENRYRHEYLEGEPLRRFDRYRDRMLDLLELPGAGRVLGNVLWLLRAPYRIARDYVVDLIVRPSAPSLPEQSVLSGAMTAWLDRLHAEALKRAGSHPIWKSIAHDFDAGIAPVAREQFQQSWKRFELRETDALDKAGQEMVRDLESNSVLLLGLRGAKLTADIAVVAGVLAATWVPSWYHLLLIPLGISLTHQVAELGVRGVAESARSRVRNQREALLEVEVTAPLAATLAEWPATRGSALERLQQVLHRVPVLIRSLEERVKAKNDH